MILDAYAIVAYLREEAVADEVEVLLLDGGCAPTSSALAEVTDQLIRLDGLREEVAAAYLAGLGLESAVPLDGALAAAAGRLRARHYHRIRRSVSMADCIGAATAHSLDRPLVTFDPHLLDLCFEERIGTVVLPGSDGSRWSPS